MSPLLRSSGLTKSYRRGAETVHAVRGVDLEIHAGELVALAGPSGSGKTTLLTLLAGWEQPDAGHLVLRDAPLPHPAELGWDVVAVVPQRLGLIDELSLRENVELPLRLSGGGIDAGAVDEVVDAFALTDVIERLPGETSLGEQQRAALARALVRRPRLVLADEPAGHQDEASALAVMTALVTAARSGTTCLVATHNPDHLAFADRVLRIHEGRLRTD